MPPLEPEADYPERYTRYRTGRRFGASSDWDQVQETQQQPPSTTPPTLSGIAELLAGVGEDPWEALWGPAAAASSSSPQAASTDENSVISRLLRAFGEDIGYLRQAPYTTAEEQAMRERERARLRNEYQTARERLLATMGPQMGLSGPLLGQMRQLAEEEARRSAEIDRDIFLQAAQERRSRLAEARQMLQTLEALERARQAEARGIEAGLEQSQRQRLLDLMALLGIAPSTAQATGLSESLLNYAGQLSNQAQQRAASAWGGLGDAAALLWQLLSQPRA